MVFVLSWALPLFAQESTSSYPGDELFIQEVGDKLKTVKHPVHKAKVKQLLQKYEENWGSFALSFQEKEELYELFQFFVKEKKPTYPVLYEYFLDVYLLGDRKVKGDDFNAWISYVKDLPESKQNKTLLKTLRFTSDFLENDVLQSRSFFKWYARNADFDFVYDTAFSVRFENTNLVCSSKKDSIYLENTKGIFFLEESLFRGEGGKAYWLRGKQSKDEVYADIYDYEQNTTTSKLKIDSVTFYNSKFFPFGVCGKLEDKVYAARNRRASYPKFSSSRKDYFLKDFFPNISMLGGVGMEGGDFVGNADTNHFVSLELKKNGERYLRSKSRKVIVDEKKMTAYNAEVVVYLSNDSVYHPGLDLDYEISRHEITLSRDEKGISTSPFYDSFHGVDIFADQMVWGLDSLRMAFQRIPSVGRESKIDLLSKNYFNERDFDHFKGISTVNPLYEVKRFLKKYDTKEIYVKDFVRFFKKPKEQVIALFLSMSNKGLGVYSAEEKKIIIKEQFEDYLLSKAGRKDYDVLRFDSYTKGGQNAILDLSSFDLELNGVSEVYLSDSQLVNIIPDHQEIVLKKNRNFKFTGMVHAGLFDFYARECEFDYKDFKLNLHQVDSLAFYVRPNEGAEHSQDLIKVNNVIADLKGELLIDNPTNKSGQKSFPQYPIFDSKEESSVYFDRIPVQDSTLTRDRFVYHVDPFVLDSLDNFSTSALKFKGYLESGGIFPDIDMSLGVVKDYSLGFLAAAGPEGLDVYDGRGRYYDSISLSNKGFKGKGRLDYLTSTTYSSEFVFYPDSLKSVTDSVNIKPQLARIEFPPAEGDVLSQNWLPYQDKMFLETQKTEMTFHDQGKFKGLITLAPHGCMGDGVMYYDQSQLESNEMQMKHHSLESDTANFYHYTIEEHQLAFSSTGYGTDIDFDKREGTFHATSSESMMEFPFNQYYCSMDEILWFMDENRMSLNNQNALNLHSLNTMKKEELIDVDLSGSDFVSTHPEQDSLSFFSATAEYDMEKYIIQAEDVKLIKVADVAIFPGDGKVKIQPNAVMEPLVMASIIADTSSRMHNIYDANVEISSRRKYHASGIYDYVDVWDGVQQLYFNDIGVDTLGQTHAVAALEEGNAFSLNPFYYFVGDVHLDANNELLRFDGGFQLGTDCYALNSGWVQFDTVLDPKQIIIPIADSLENESGRYMRAGLSFSNTQNKFYPSFFEMPFSRDDEAAFEASGHTFYDTISKSYVLGEMERFNDSIYSNQFLSMNIDSCVISGNGELDLLSDMNQIDLTSYGSFRHLVIPDSTYFDVLLAIDFKFNNKLSEIMEEKLRTVNTEGVNIAGEKKRRSLIQLLGTEEALQYVDQVMEEGYVEDLPDKLRKQLVFNDLQLVWNDQTRSYISTTRLGMSNVNNTMLNKYYSGYVEIEKRKTGNRFNIYIEAAPNNWFYFAYKDQILQVLSSDEEFNEILMDLPEKKRMIKGDTPEELYEFVVAPIESVANFKDKMRVLEKY